MTSAPTLLGFLADRLADAETAWSLGTFGAIAEFTRDADETATLAIFEQIVDWQSRRSRNAVCVSGKDC